MRIVFCLFFALAAVSAHALPDFWKLFNSHYKPAAGSDIAKAQCVTCHTATGQTSRNPFGKAVEAKLDEQAGKELTVDMLRQIEALDSDGDAASNGDEARAGTLPGDPRSKPGAATKPDAGGDLIPKHSFHPTVVHFPIALFLFGAVLDFLGWRRKDGGWRIAAYLGMFVGAVSSLLALPTGVLAWQRLGFALEGTLLIHLILAISASAFMLGLVAWRRKGEVSSGAYWATLAVGAVLVSVAGHFGGMMVYG